MSPGPSWREGSIEDCLTRSFGGFGQGLEPLEPLEPWPAYAGITLVNESPMPRGTELRVAYTSVHESDSMWESVP